MRQCGAESENPFISSTRTSKMVRASTIRLLLAAYRDGFKSQESFHNIGTKKVDKSKLLDEGEAEESFCRVQVHSNQEQAGKLNQGIDATFIRNISTSSLKDLEKRNDLASIDLEGDDFSAVSLAELHPPNITPAHVRDLLRNHLNLNRHRPCICATCYSSPDIADLLSITDIHNCHLFHYYLQTVIEKREAKWTFQPFIGECDESEELFESDPAKVISNMEDVWSIQIPTPPVGGPNTVVYVTVPWTSAVKPCYECMGQGQKTCDRCHGTGWAPCKFCVSTGLRSSVSGFSYGYTLTCHYCDAHGKQKCDWCGGLRTMSCRLCEGTSRLKYFLQMRITWVRRVSDEFVGEDPLPPIVRRETSGKLVFKEQGDMVNPVCAFSSPELESVSMKCLLEHSKLLPDERIVEQIHEVHAFPLTTVSYTLRKRNAGVFFIHGWDEQVYAPDLDAVCHLVHCNIM